MIHIPVAPFSEIPVPTQRAHTNQTDVNQQNKAIICH